MLNSNAAQSNLRHPHAGLRHPGRVRRGTGDRPSYVGRTQEIVAPRVFKLGFGSILTNRTTIRYGLAPAVGETRPPVFCLSTLAFWS